jgi:hypothetical protein
VDAIVSRAVADDRRIVGWSNFDRDRLIQARPDLTRELVIAFAIAVESGLHEPRGQRRSGSLSRRLRTLLWLRPAE